MASLRPRTAAALATFAAAYALHAWHTMYAGAKVDPALARWAVIEEQPSLAERLTSYLSTGGVWLGYSYAVAAGFALYSVWGVFKRRTVPEGQKAVGGLSLSALLAGGACFMTGCCGSPMLAVWIGLLGAAAAPWLGPAAALFTTVSVFAAWRMMKKRQGYCDITCECSER